ncbi:MAG: aminopeptidase P family protein, partial [Bacteroidota bacterium]
MAHDVQKLIDRIQETLRQEKIEGWLFYNFRGSNVFATRILDLPAHLTQTRRYYYLIPAKGIPRKLVHNIEQYNLDHLPGERKVYLSWQSLEEGLAWLLAGMSSVAMEYSPRNAIPYVSNVDAGTVELIRGTGVNIVSSANLVQYFEARWDHEQMKDNERTATHLRQIVDLTFGFIKQRINAGTDTTEYDVQQFMLS